MTANTKQTATQAYAEMIRNASSDPVTAKKLAKLADLYVKQDGLRRIMVAGDAAGFAPAVQVIAIRNYIDASERMVRYCLKHGLPIP